MGRRRSSDLVPFIHLAAAILVYSGSLLVHETDATPAISTRQMDITTPMTTFPITNPSTPTTTPMLNPTDSSSDSPTITNPPSTTSPHGSSSSAGSWCVATQSASKTALQVALDYACGYGGADCSEIQPGGSCFVPITLRDHASYAFNQYYQKNSIPTSCNFGGSAVTTSIDPSYGTCQYPSTSTTSSVLNTTNSMGSRVFGAGPIITPPPPAAAIQSSISYFQHILVIFIIVMLVSPT